MRNREIYMEEVVGPEDKAGLVSACRRVRST